jgi:hypothetical protein
MCGKERHGRQFVHRVNFAVSNLYPPMEQTNTTSPVVEAHIKIHSESSDIAQAGTGCQYLSETRKAENLEHGEEIAKIVFPGKELRDSPLLALGVS